MTTALVVPDPRTTNVPAGWWDANVLPAIQSCASWDQLDEYEGQLLAMASLIESFGGDGVEFEKALRVVECRRGELLGDRPPGRPLTNSPSVENFPASEGAKARYRQIARYWPDLIYPYLLAETEKWKVTQASVLRLVQRQETRAEQVEVAMARGVFPVLYADPPWRYEHVKTENRAVENQYPTMTLDDICALTVPAADDAVLFLWATSPKLAEAMQVLTAWGFTYRTCMVWVKDKIGMGYYARQQHELLLIGAKGEPPVPAEADRPSSVLEAPRTQHSAKPPAFYDVIERMYPGVQKIELFARQTREGWAAWGNQAA